MKNNTLDEYMRAAVLGVALAVAGYLAVVGNAEAMGAVLALLGLAGSYLFRGKVQTPRD